jgi:hypothetical protein
MSPKAWVWSIVFSLPLWLLLYGAIDDNAAALIAGFVGLLFALGAAQLPVWRQVRRASRELAESDRQTPLLELDFSDADFDWPDRRAA